VVLYQSAKQGSFLAFQPYNYVPAQAIFVGALIGMEVAMIAGAGGRRGGALPQSR
jgi:hypothetical protein